MDFGPETRLLTNTVLNRWFYPHRVGCLGLESQVSVKITKENGRRVIVLHSGWDTIGFGCWLGLASCEE